MSSERRRPSAAETLRHARRRIARILEWTGQDDERSYLANIERQDAVERNFIAIGEAIKELSRALDLDGVVPSGPWRETARFRDFLAHQYDEGVSHPDVWRTIQEDLPVLDAALAKLEARLP